METVLQFSKNILKELEEVVSRDNPIFSTEKGDLFILENLPLGALRLKIPLGEYLDFIESLNEDVKPERIYLVPVESRTFQIVINAQIYKENGDLFINDRKVVLL